MADPSKITSHLAGLDGCFVAGGAITSIYTNAPINDLDIYPKSAKARDEAIQWAFEGGLWCSDASARAITFSQKGDDSPDIQIMHFDVFPTAKKIFNAFDFTVCMGAYDLDAKKFALDKRFLEHCSQRFLKFNPGTRFPYASAWRVRKYEDRGFTIGKMEFQKILMACAERPIASWDDLREQIGGVYGEVLTIPDGEPFSKEGAWRALDTLRFVGGGGNGYQSVEEAIACISDREIPYFIAPDNQFSDGETVYAKIWEDGGWEKIGAKPKHGRLVGMEEIFPSLTFYKMVRRDGDTLRSLYRSQFTYAVGQTINSDKPYIFCYDTIDRARRHYGSGDRVILELAAEPRDIVYGGEIRLKKCRVVAEHPVTEREKEAA